MFLIFGKIIISYFWKSYYFIFLEKNVSQILENVHFQRYITAEICKNDSFMIDASSRHLQTQLQHTLLPIYSTLTGTSRQAFQVSSVTCDILYSTSNCHQLMRMSCSTWILTALILNIKIRHLNRNNTEEHHHHCISTFYCGLICKKGHLYTTSRCLSFLREQTSSNIKLQDQISPIRHMS